jgi:hypothetical protein
LGCVRSSFFYILKIKPWTIQQLRLQESPISKPSNKPKKIQKILVEKHQTKGPTFSSPITPENAIPGEKILSFKNKKSFRKFLEFSKIHNIPILDNISNLSSVLIRSNPEIEKLLSNMDSEFLNENHNLIVAIPPNPIDLNKSEGSNVPFLEEAPEWLGLPDDNSLWGQGVLIAVLDSGIKAHKSLDNDNIEFIDLIREDLPSNIHGTAVSSILLGEETVRGIAPAASLLNIKVLGAEGSGDVFTLSKGIIEATNKGAKLINLSLGSSSDSPILQEAIQYAQDAEILIVAAAGNDGSSNNYYPAQYEGVIGVSAIDKMEQRPQFSNYGDYVDIAAPGVGIQAAYEGDQIAYYDGTSFATPYVTGVLASILSSDKSLSPSEAGEIIMQQLNEAGNAGKDPYYGNGILDISRIVRRNERGNVDVAITNYLYEEDEGEHSKTLNINVQNQGTEWLQSLKLEIDINGRKWSVQLGSLNKNKTASHSLKIPSELIDSEKKFNISSSIRSLGQKDSNPSNNRLLEIISFEEKNRSSGF